MSEWNLASAINTDLNSEELFNDLPAVSSQPKLKTQIEEVDSRQAITTPEYNLVSKEDRPALEKISEELDKNNSFSPKALTQNNVTDIAASLPQAQQAQSPDPEDDWTLGKYFTAATGYLQKLDALQKQNDFGSGQQRGRNRARFESYKSRVMDELADNVENKYGVPKELIGPLYSRLSKGSLGFRSREEIDQIANVMKNRQAILLDDNGVETVIPIQEGDWESAIQLHQKAKDRVVEYNLANKKTGGVEEISKWQGVMEKTLDAEGNVMPDRMGEYEKAASEIDRLTGAPTGVSKFASRYNSKQDRISKMTAAMDSGIPYKGLAVEQIPSEILKLNQETVELAVENAPYFGANDREAAAKWVTDPATKGLPFRSDYEGKKIPHFVTSELGVYNIWSPKEKTWMVVDKRKPKPETATAAEPTAPKASVTNRALKTAINLGAGASEAILGGAGLKQKAPDGSVKNIKFGRITDEDVKNWKSSDPIAEPPSIIPGDYRNAPVVSGVLPMKPRPN